MHRGPDYTLPSFGRRLKQARRAAGVKQLVLTEALEVNQSTISRWEAGMQVPSPAVQQQAFDCLSACRRDDAVLRRLVESSAACLHLVEEATHVCLAYSKRRAAEWQSSDRGMLGTSLWQFATEEIQAAELRLENSDWWAVQQPTPHYFQTSERKFDEITISAGGVLWERLYLADGTPARLCTFA